jgi:glycosyltransferase involved in cell wall biosynthesis/SAM-dependent methyltransferase
MEQDTAHIAEYLDGAEAEILRCLESTTDRASDSDALAACIHDWPTRYHFSRQRANLLRPLHIWRGARVLDIGAGSGTLSRYLGEIGADVVALEPTPLRARAASLRCADLPNVRVVTGAIDSYRETRPFDLVTCIGVLEYALGSDASRRAFLEHLRRVVGTDGTLVVAIENQLGLRYLLGYGEDHLDEPWAGIEGYGGQHRVATPGQRTLGRLLAEAGFDAQRWLYPFPDYKLPSTVVSETVYRRPDAEELVDKILRWPSSGEATQPARLCDDRRAHRVLLREGLGPAVANSFLVLASRSDAAIDRLVPASFLALHMGWDRRRQWRGWKRFEQVGAATLVTAGASVGEQSQGWLTRLVAASRQYVPGPTVEQRALDACRESSDALAAVLTRWRRHLRDLERPHAPSGSSPFCSSSGSQAALPPQYLDVVLSNFVVDGAGHLHYVDDEWRADGPVRADLVCTRALYWFATDLVRHGVRHPFGAEATVSTMTERMAQLCEMRATPLAELIDAEADFQSRVLGVTAERWRQDIAGIAQISQSSPGIASSLPFTTLRAAVTEMTRHREARVAALNEVADAARRERHLAAELHASTQLVLQRDVEIGALHTAVQAGKGDAARLQGQLEAAHERATALDAERQRIHGIASHLAQALRQRQAEQDASRWNIEALQRRLDEALVRVALSESRTTDAEAEHRAIELRHQRAARAQSELARELSAERARQRAARGSRLARRVERVTELVALGRHLWQVRARRRLASIVTSRSARREAMARAARIETCGLFDPESYQDRAGVLLSPLGLALHYEMVGRRMGLMPCALFDTAYYLDTNPDVAGANANPLLHYLDHGAAEGRRPHPLFDSAYYLEQHPEVAACGDNPLRHFLTVGAAAGFRPTPLFDTAWYLERYQDVVAAGVNPLVHYLTHGAADGRHPNPYFDTTYYLEHNPDVARSGMNPLVHYVRHGAGEGRRPSAAFDPACYLAARPDVAGAGGDPLDHLLRHGLREGMSDAGTLTVLDPHIGVYLEALPPPRVKRGEPFKVRGWIRSERHVVAAVTVEAMGASRFHFDLPVAATVSPGHPHAFEARLTLHDEGDTRLRVGVRLPDGSLADAAALRPVAVSGDTYCHAMRGHLPTVRRFSVLYLDGMGRRFQSPRYRIDNMREALALAGIDSDVTDAAALHNDLSRMRTHDILVLFRAGWDWRLHDIVTQARAWHIPVVFDVDDYVFEPAIATVEYIAGIRDWSPAQVEEYQYGVRVYRETLEHCDYFTGSSDFLVERARALGRTAFLLNNHLNERLVSMGEAARAVPKRRDRVEIVYISGTRTHQQDFATMVPALAELMRERPHVHLRIVGYLDLGEYAPLQPFASRIHEEGFLTWDEIPVRVAGAHLTIAPLEQGNPFCEAKSELKYFEGAAFGMAVLATPTDPFRRAIRPGETGSLCGTVDEWRTELFRMVDDDGHRAQVSAAGTAHALDRFGPAHAARQATEVYRAIIQAARVRRGVPERALAINWVMVEPFAGSGGHNDIFIAANEMVKRGHAVTLFFGQDEASGDAIAIRQYIERHFGYEPLFEVGLGFENITHCDALIATHYSTAHVVKRLAGRTALAAYFVQDYEPYFAPVGTEYFAAEQTYRYGFFCITLGPWLRTMIEKHGARARDIPFWVDPRYYYAADGRSGATRPRVIGLGRPQMPRRCYDLGLAGLALLAEQRPDVEICLFGAASFPGDIRFPYTNLGILTPTELGDLYRSSDIGVAFSTTNPSLVTFEMMACGLPLVDLDVLDSRNRHGGFPAELVEPSPEAIADGIGRLLGDAARLDAMRREATAFTRNMPTPQASLAEISAFIEDEIARSVAVASDGNGATVLESRMPAGQTPPR